MTRCPIRLVDTLRTRLRAPLEKLVAAEVARQVEAQKLDALYSYRWHGDRSRLHIPDSAVVNNALFNMSGGRSPSVRTRSSATTSRCSPAPMTSSSSDGPGSWRSRGPAVTS